MAYFLFGILVLVMGAITSNSADTTTASPSDTEADKIVKMLISPGGDIYETFMEMANATYGYILLQKDVWEEFEKDEDLFLQNMFKIGNIISYTNKTVKSILNDVSEGTRSESNHFNMQENIEREAEKIASNLKYNILGLYQKFEIPESFMKPYERVVETLVALYDEVDIYCGCAWGTYKSLYAQMESLQKKAIGWSVIIDRVRQQYNYKGKAKRALAAIGREAVFAARFAKEFNYRLVVSRLPNLITNMITGVKEVLGPLLKLWKKYEIEVETDIDFARFYIKGPKDGVTRSPYNIDELQQKAKYMPYKAADLYWEMRFYRGYG